jgi:phosphoglycolate phosphatase
MAADSKDNLEWSSCRALLFDKDGTIINFRLMWLGWCREVVRELSSVYSATGVERGLAAWGVDLALGLIKPDGHLAVGSTGDLCTSLARELASGGTDLAKAESDVRRAMYTAYRTIEEKKLIQPIVGVTEAIKELHRRGYKLALVTTDDSEKASRNLQMLDLDPYFEVILGCDRVVRCKPAPDLVLEACRLLAVKPSESAVIGDTEADMKMGRAAGAACCIGVASGVTFPGELSCHADLVLESAAYLVEA